MMTEKMTIFNIHTSLKNFYETNLNDF